MSKSTAITAADARKVRAAATRGALLMDQFVPKWTKKIDKSTLELADPSQCLLGQTFETFTEGAKVLAETAVKKTLDGTGLKLSADSTFEIDVLYYGFEGVGYGQYEHEYSLLGEQWRAEIIAREQSEKRSRAARKGAATRKANARTSRRRS